VGIYTDIPPVATPLAAGWVWPKVEDWNWETIFTDIISRCSTTVTYLASKAIEFGEKRKKGYYTVQGHSRSSRSVPIESRYLRLPISD